MAIYKSRLAAGRALFSITFTMHATNTPPRETSAKGLAFWLSLALLSAVILVYVVVIKSSGPSQTGLTGPEIGQHVPLLQLEPLTGDAQPVSLDDLPGHVTVLNFWGTWCPPCRRKFPELVALAAKFADQPDARIYLVSCDGNGDGDKESLRDATAAFLKASRVSLPTYTDREENSRRAIAIGLDLDGFAYPTTIIFDRQATIRGFWVGYSPNAAEEMERLVHELLAEAPRHAAAVSRPNVAQDR